ncbi:MAG: hypothetical protein MUC43_13920 [Pirellula sp.]|jgi:hypothetical protein|nr:hypothetical protein [Pirellula sp.]
MLMVSLHGESRWETQIAEGWKVSDLDDEEIHRTMEEAIRRGRIDDPGSTSLETILAGFGLLVDGRLDRAEIALLESESRSNGTIGLPSVRRVRNRSYPDSERELCMNSGGPRKERVREFGTDFSHRRTKP